MNQKAEDAKVTIERFIREYDGTAIGQTVKNVYLNTMSLPGEENRESNLIELEKCCLAHTSI